MALRRRGDDLRFAGDVLESSGSGRVGERPVRTKHVLPAATLAGATALGLRNTATAQLQPHWIRACGVQPRWTTSCRTSSPCIARSRRARGTRGVRRTRWAHRARRTHRARRARRARRPRRARRTRGRGTRKAWAFATPVRHIFRVLLERWRTTLPRREIGAGVEQIAGHVDLLALGGVRQTLRRRLTMGLDGNDDRRRDSAERQSKTAVGHHNSSRVGCRNGRFSTAVNERAYTWARQDDVDSASSYLRHL
jgi:hypothetical protein